jgi:nicotinate dehydrogenase subunit B
MASKQLGAPVSQLTISAGVVSVASDSSKKVSYGELIGGQRFNLTVTGKAPTKKPSEHKIVGKSIKRPEVPSKLNGRFTYIQDVKVAGMFHGRVVRPPSINATLVRVNGFKKRVPGLVKMVVQKNYVGVVCEREEQAIAAAKNLRVTWKDPGGINSIDELWSQMESQEGRARLLVADGDVDKALKGAAKVVEAAYYYPFQLHGSMGPSCSVADVRGDEATVWSPTQGVYPLRSMIAKFLGLKDQAVHVIYVEGPGCYGLNGADSVSLDAVIMSKAVGRPVRVQWMRADEHEWEHFGQPMVMKARGGLDADGNLVAWDYQAWSGGRGGRPGNVGAANLPPGFLTGLTLPTTRPEAPRFPPLGADNSNTVAGYLQDEEGRLENARVVARAVDSPFFTGPLRSPARIQNTFANESFIDELAAAARADPVEFRLRYIGDERLAEVIRRAAEKYGWQSRPSPKSAERQRAHRSRDRRDAVRGRGRLRRHDRRGAGQPEDREGDRDTDGRRPRRRDHHQPRRYPAADRGERRPGNQSHAQGGGQDQERARDDGRLGGVLRLPVHRHAQGGHRADQPARPAGGRHGRERDDQHASRHRERDLRRDGRPSPSAAVHAGAGQGGARLAVVPKLVGHPGLPGGWGCRSHQLQRGAPDEVAR